MWYREFSRLLVAGLVFGLIWGGSPSEGAASDDYFGDGDGHYGAKSVSAPEVVNAYSAVAVDVVVDDVSIEVADGTKFTAGDLAVVWQVNGYATPASGDQSEIDLTGQPVGRFEFVRVDSVVGNVLGLHDPMNNAFAAANSQVVFVPEYTDVTVDAAGELQAADWDPVAGEGGIVAFFATGTVTVDGLVTATGAGFLGGTDLGNSGTNGCTGLDEPSPTGAEKGESIAGLDFVSGDPPGGTGRGNRANGAGGGVCHNSGGGGGGHGGLGGIGGRTWRGDPDPVIPNTGRDIGGLGGAPLAYTALTHLTMGGGGGAGQQNNDVGGAGSDGGGVVLVRAGVVAGSGSFEANGDDGNDSTGGFNDAAGGAGGGGLVIVRAAGSLGCGSVQVVGGEGGTAQFDDHGTGGGGSGGHTLLQGATIACAADVSGGLPGVQTDPTDPPGLNYGALPGEPGDEESVGGALALDTDGDGLLDIQEGEADADGDGTPNWLQACGDGTATAMPVAEACDDGDGDDTNACNNACRFNVGFGACATAADCVSAPGVVCGVTSSLCQWANGNGLCTAGDAATVCESAICDEGSGTCEACLVDGDCALGERCDVNACILRTCGDGTLDPGEACDDGDVDDTNECANTCLFNAGNGVCATSDDCAGSGLVCDDPDAVCRYPLGSGPCTEFDEASVCAGGVCDTASSTCEACADNVDCATDERCDANTCVLESCGDGVLDSGEVCDDGVANGDAPLPCAFDCRLNVGGDCAGDDECTADATCGDESTCSVPDPRTIDSDGDGIPDEIEEAGFILQGGRGVGCHVGVTDRPGSTGVLLLVLAFCLGIRRYRRN